MKNHHHQKTKPPLFLHDCFLGFKKCEFFFVGGWIFWNQSTRSISRRLFCQLAPFGAHGLCAVSVCASYGCQRWMVWEKHWLQRVPKCCVTVAANFVGKMPSSAHSSFEMAYPWMDLNGCIFGFVFDHLFVPIPSQSLFCVGVEFDSDLRVSHFNFKTLPSVLLVQSVIRSQGDSSCASNFKKAVCMFRLQRLATLGFGQCFSIPTAGTKK